MFKRITSSSCFAAALLAASTFALPAAPTVAPPAGDCIVPKWVPTKIKRIGAHTGVCKTYFLGILVNTSTVACQDSKRTTPGHYKCTSRKSEIEDCRAGLNNVIETTQAYKGECEGATGLNVDVGGVEVGIDWWKAVCKTNGAPILAVKVTDSRTFCVKDVEVTSALESSGESH